MHCFGERREICISRPSTRHFGELCDTRADGEIDCPMEAYFPDFVQLAWRRIDMQMLKSKDELFYVRDKHRFLLIVRGRLL